MIFSMMLCHFCHKPMPFEGNPMRKEVCPHCSSDVHCCLNCTFYDKTAHNQCREPQAEWVPNKDKANFCDFFTLRQTQDQADPVREAAEARQQMDKLFKKR